MTIHRMRGSIFLVGDRVRFTAAFLRSTVQYTGPEAPCSYGPFARGKVVSMSGSTDLVRVLWDDGYEKPVNRFNLEREDAPCLD